MPFRSNIYITEPEVTAIFMPSYMKPTGMIGIKTATMFEANRTKGIPYIQGMVSLFDGQTGAPVAVLDGMTITALRTGAASGYATRLLAREDASICTIFGAGAQARTQLEAICTVRDIKKTFVFDVCTEAAQRFSEEMAAALNVEIVLATSPAEAVREADVICCSTPSTVPLFDDADLKSGVHINAVGSYKPHMQEVPEATVLRSKLYVDHRESALEETGDLIIPIQKGLMTESHIIAELGEVATGRAPRRTSSTDITLFKSVGVAVQDLAAAAMIFKKAEALNIGSVAEL